MKDRLRRSFVKNAPEIRALLNGEMRSFITRRGGADRLVKVPVFTFHTVEPERLDKQLRYLRSNGYRSLDGDELEAAVQERMTHGNEIALTFDDATWTFWAYAFPLLKKYDFRATLFAIPSIVPQDSKSYPNLEDVWKDRCTRRDLYERGKVQPLCTWRELAIMHESGIVDIQSHSLTHARVAISSRLVDFVHPAFDTDCFGNVNLPLSSVDNPDKPERKLRLGAPVFESAPRMACRPRFREAPELVEALTHYVEKQHGRTEFFERSTWRKELAAIFGRWPTQGLGSFETSQEMESAVRRELIESRKILEERLVGKEVRHFCYPWFTGSYTADRLAAEAGYRTVHYGLEINGDKTQTARVPLRIRRISEEYIFSLPGNGRLPTWPIWRERIRCFIGRGRSGVDHHGGV